MTRRVRPNGLTPNPENKKNGGKNMAKWVRGIATAFFLAAAATSEVAQAAAQVTGIELVSSVRTSRTGFDYTFRIRGENGEPALTGARATVVSVAPSLVLLDDSVELGSLSANAPFTSQDTFKVRVDRAVAFDPTMLRWTVLGTAVQPPGGGRVLTGAPNDNAIASTIDYLDPDRAGISIEEATVEDGVRVVRTRLVLRMTPTATVAQINSILGSVNGAIVAMGSGSPYLTIAIPDPGSLPVLDSILAAVNMAPGVVEVFADTLADREILPPGSISFDPGVSANQMAIRAPAVWTLQNQFPANAAGAPVLLIVDYFGNGAPSSGRFNVSVPNTNHFKTLSVTPSDYDGHGYHVLGIAAARIDDTDEVAGVYAAKQPVEVHAIDIYENDGRELPTGVILWNLLQRLESLRGRLVVLNTSLSLYSGRAANGAPVENLWISELDRRNLQHAFFHATAAGNYRNGQDASSARELFREGVRHFLNGAIVESRQALRIFPTVRYTPSPCLDSNTHGGGTVSAIGVGVRSYTSRDGAIKPYSGTSMATPQVAGVALNLFWLRPDWSAQDVGRAITLSRRFPANPCNVPGRGGAAFIDAYVAALRTDQGLSSGARVRRALLDRLPLPLGDRAFHADDLQAFLDNIRLVSWYSEFDLNGDGTTQFRGLAEPHDLDADGTISSTPHEITASSGVTYYFDERAVSDGDALCWYSHKMYGDTASDLQVRDSALTTMCPRESLSARGAASIGWRFGQPPCGVRGGPCSRETFVLPYTLSVSSAGDYVAASSTVNGFLDVTGSGSERKFDGHFRGTLSASSTAPSNPYEVVSQLGSGWVRRFEVSRLTRFSFTANLKVLKTGDTYNCRALLAVRFVGESLSLAQGAAGVRCNETTFPWGNTFTTDVRGVIPPGVYELAIGPGTFGVNVWDVASLETTGGSSLNMDGSVSLQLLECPATGVCQP
jgi:hypothetical protein